jgi:Zn-dependent protease
MKEMSFSPPRQSSLTLGTIFQTPVVVNGWQGFPLAELIAWLGFSWVACRRHPHWRSRAWLSAGAMQSVIIFAADWCHDIAHLAVASLIGKPADAIRLNWGTPQLIYSAEHNQDVSPRQHQLRALGGPVFSFTMVPISWIIKSLTAEGTLARETTSFALWANTVVAVFSLAPIPFVDGGSLFKWALVRKGRSLPQAQAVVRHVDRYAGYSLLIASVGAVKKRKAVLGAGLAALAATCLAIGFGLLKEQEG